MTSTETSSSPLPSEAQVSVDPVELEVIANRLDEIQRIMKHRLFHTGYSVILRESFDGTAGMTDATGQVIGASGFLTHTTPYGIFVKAILERYGPDRIYEDDVFITNDPYLGGPAHTPDVAIAAPVFVDGRLLAFCTSMGHKPDVGGLAPGTSSPSSRSIFHEGLLVPPTKLHERGVANESLEMVLRRNSRSPDLLMGDIRGQIGCTRIGTELVRELCKKTSPEILEAAMAQLLRMSKQRVEIALGQLPDGEADEEKWLDGNGVSDDPVRVCIKVVKSGKRLSIDFTGTGAQSIGPVNVVYQIVRAAALGAALSFIDHTIPNNEGVGDAIDVILPPNTIVNPQQPAPVNSYIPTTHLAFNGVIAALGRLYPHLAVAESGLGEGAMTLGYLRQGANFVHYEIAPTALGGTSQGDGASIICPMPLYETIQPIEIVETEFPVRVTNFSIRQDSAGAGKHRGGVGCIREFEVLAPCQLISRLSQRKFGAGGIAGGHAPAISRTLYMPHEVSAARSLKGLDEVQMQEGERVRIENSGGGGWGDPRERPVDLVVADVADGYVSVECARTAYGVIVEVDKQGRHIGRRD